MTNQEMVTGMVLSAVPIGEFDKRLVILTKERGKIAAFAKGARRLNCALFACSQPFAFGTFQVYQGRNSYTVVGGEMSAYFGGLRENPEAAYYGFYFCEFLDFLSRENVEASESLKLLYQTLRALEKGTIPFPLIRCIFELKSIAINGEAPQMFQCVKCGTKEAGFLFSPEVGGLVCENCDNGITGALYLDEASVYTMQFILATPIEKLYTFHVSETVLKNLEKCLKRYLAVYVGHSFRSLEFLDMFSS